MKLVSALILLAASAAPGMAQVGYPPSESPYHDLPFKQEITVYGGHFGGGAGKAGVGPTAGPLIGLRYSMHLGGPVEATAHLARVSSSRIVKDPGASGAEQIVGEQSLGLYLADVGIAVNLTGRKSYHRLVPLVAIGLGVASARDQDDVGGFAVGTPFALNFGTGVRFVPEGNFSARLDVSNYMYQLSYPSAYFRSPPLGGGSAILGPREGSSEWTHHAVITLGVSYLFSR
ncbi:MAG TPA: hypothetical protein VIQ74_05100 [Gemmatimonadaceae bacterium]